MDTKEREEGLEIGGLECKALVSPPKFSLKAEGCRLPHIS